MRRTRRVAASFGFHLRTYLFVSVAILAAATSIAQEPQTSEEIGARLEAIAEASNNDPAQFIPEVEGYLLLTQERELPALEISSGSLLASMKITLGKHEEALELIERYLPAAQVRDETKAILELLSSRSRIAQLNTEFGIALEYADQALRLAQDENSAIFIASSLASLGQIQQKMGQHTQALSHLIDALSVYESLDNQRGQSLVLTSIATSYSELGDLEQATDYYQQALDAVLAMDQQFNASIILYNMAVAYAKDEQHDQARHYLKRSLDISRQLGDELGVAYSLAQLAQTEDAAGNQSVAVAYYQEALPILEKSGATLNYLQSAMGLARALAATGDQEQANDWLKAITPEVEKLDQARHYATYYRTQSFVTQQAGDYQAALEEHQQYTDYLIRAHGQAQQENLNELRVQFETLQKGKENRLLAQQNELAQLTLEKQAREQQLYLLAVVVLTIGVTLVALFLIRQWRQRKRFQEMAMRDELTKARNRRAIFQIAEYKFREAEKLNLPLLFVLVDLDHFKHVNDHYGHAVGDEVLKAFADSAAESLRSHDRFGRVGGEEWLLVLPDTRKVQAEVIFERLRRGFAARSIPGLPEPHEIRFSMGCASVEDSYSSLDALLKKADDNLYCAKEAGRDQVKT